MMIMDKVELWFSKWGLDYFNPCFYTHILFKSLCGCSLLNLIIEYFKMNIEFYKKNKLYIILLSSLILTTIIKFNGKELDELNTYFFLEFFTSLIVTISIPLINIYLQKLYVKEKVTLKIIFFLNIVVIVLIHFISMKTNEIFLLREGGPESEYLLQDVVRFSFFQYNYSFLLGYIIYFLTYFFDFFINQKKRKKDRIIVYHRDKILPLKVKNIYVFYIKNNITYVFTSKGEKYTSNYNLKQVREKLDTKDFFQINRQTILSKESIKLVSPHMNRKLKIQTSI